MDGNQRWAKINNLSPKKGYTEGINKITEIVEYSIVNKIKFLTIYALSSENYKRSNIEILFHLIKNDYIKFIKKINVNKEVKIRIIGSKDNLSKEINMIFNKIEKDTEKNDKLILNIIFNYSVIDEIKHISKKVSKIEKLTDKDIKSFMYLNPLPDPDVLIRTGGFQRLSNFILLNLSYTELYFTKTLWPDLSINELNKIVNSFRETKRNYGL